MGTIELIINLRNLGFVEIMPQVLRNDKFIVMNLHKSDSAVFSRGMILTTRDFLDALKEFSLDDDAVNKFKGVEFPLIAYIIKKGKYDYYYSDNLTFEDVREWMKQNM